MVVYRDYIIKTAHKGLTSKIKELVFSVLMEYGLPPDDTGPDQDLNDVEANYLERNGYFGVIYDKKDQLVGTIGLYDLGQGRAEIRKMYLVPTVRGQGLGKFLLNYLVAKARQKGYTHLELETASVLKEAILLYQQFGFKQITKNNEVARCDQVYELPI
ncbi:MAG: GNAT family N-acetyltransferase [Candidatus Cyclobacteriaceae bacterium M3_2C_046]